MMSAWAETCAGLIWLATVGMMIVKTPRSVATLYRTQALGVAGLGATIALSENVPILWVTVGLTVLVRIFVVPAIINRGIKTLSAPYSAKSPIGVGSLIVYAVVLTAAGMLSAQIGAVRLPVAAGLIIASMFVSFIHLSARYEVWSMLWALMSLDAIISAGVLVFANSLPELTDLGLFAMSLSLALVLAFVAHRIHGVKASLDVRELEELVG
jgi:hydrogenase-4 component E